MRLLTGIEDFAEFDRNYTLVLSSSWSPANYDVLSLALEKISGPVFVQPCNYGERRKLERYHPRIVALDSLPCDWLDPDAYDPISWKERSIDLIVVSNWAPFKRHWHLFQVLSRLPADLKVVCVGQPEAGYTLEDIRELQVLMGVPQSIDYRQSIPIDEVIRLQGDAKAALIFSRREGCCVAAAEALMAGTPLAILEDAHVGPKAYINPETGVLLQSESAHQQILELLEAGKSLSPREWAMKNIACTQTREKVNHSLKVQAKERGEPWTKDLIQPCWRPYPILRDPTDFAELEKDAAKLTELYPEVFPIGWMEDGRR